MRPSYLSFLLLFLFACDADTRKRANPETLHFRTTDDAELFFKNLRRTEYDYQNLKAARLDIFRHEKRSQEALYPLMIPALVVNWRYDEAYIILEGNEWVGEIRPLVVQWRDSLPQQEGRYILASNNKLEQLRFAGELYEGILDGKQFFLERDSVLLPFLDKPLDRRIFRTTMFDYYRLTGNIR